MASCRGLFIPALVFVGISLWAPRVDPGVKRELIIWNVGQGQWVTLVDENGCWHFDAGGEKAPWEEIMTLCRDRRNRLVFSHWDWDHLSFAGRMRGLLPDVCLLLPPVGRGSPRKEAMLGRLTPCKTPPPFASWVDAHGRSANDKSRVVWWRGILIPGDSTIKEEKIWVQHLSGLSGSRILVLGHHGSRTSTSSLLLDHLPRLTAAVSSARFRKYGHPHARVRRDLAKRHIPLLRTEEWGNLHFEL